MAVSKTLVRVPLHGCEAALEEVSAEIGRLSRAHTDVRERELGILRWDLEALLARVALAESEVR